MIMSFIQRELQKATGLEGTVLQSFVHSRFCVYNFVKEAAVTDLTRSDDPNMIKTVFNDIFKDYFRELALLEGGHKVFPQAGQAPNSAVLDGIGDSQDQEEGQQLVMTEGFLQKRDIFMEFMTNTLDFCKSKRFSSEKISTVLEVGYRTFYNSFSSRLTYDKAYEFYRELLLRHCHFRPPHSIYVLSLDEIKAITDYFLSSFFRHFPLYQLVFTPHLEVNIVDQGLVSKTETFGRFPFLFDLDSGQSIQKEEVPSLMKNYFAESDMKVSPEQIADIMTGDSIYAPKKQRELEKKRKEEERKARIDMVLKRELAKVQESFENQLKIQDDVFMAKLEESKKPKKK